MNSPLLNMVYSEDLDVTASYLTAVNGLDSAGIFDDQGLSWGIGAESTADFFDRAPFLVEQLADSIAFCEIREQEAPSQLLQFDNKSFWYCTKMSQKFYYVVSGSRGSFDLFKGRIERCVQMAEQALKERRHISV